MLAIDMMWLRLPNKWTPVNDTTVLFLCLVTEYAEGFSRAHKLEVEENILIWANTNLHYAHSSACSLRLAHVLKIRRLLQRCQAPNTDIFCCFSVLNNATFSCKQSTTNLTTSLYMNYLDTLLLQTYRQKTYWLIYLPHREVSIPPSVPKWELQ